MKNSASEMPALREHFNTFPKQIFVGLLEMIAGAHRGPDVVALSSQGAVRGAHLHLW